MTVKFETKSGKKYELEQDGKSICITFVDGVDKRTYKVDFCSPIVIGSDLSVRYHVAHKRTFSKQNYFSNEPITNIKIEF